jgi:hypothetical protein
MDVSMILDRLVSAAEYEGSLTANTEAAFDAVTWTDGRAKPTWAAMETEDAAYTPPIELEHVTSGVVAPTSTPYTVGDLYVDTVLNKTYVATGTASSADWTAVN